MTVRSGTVGDVTGQKGRDGIRDRTVREEVRLGKANRGKQRSARF